MRFRLAPRSMTLDDLELLLLGAEATRRIIRKWSPLTMCVVAHFRFVYICEQNKRRVWSYTKQIIHINLKCSYQALSSFHHVRPHQTWKCPLHPPPPIHSNDQGIFNCEILHCEWFLVAVNFVFVARYCTACTAAHIFDRIDRIDLRNPGLFGNNEFHK